MIEFDVVGHARLSDLEIALGQRDALARALENLQSAETTYRMTYDLDGYHHQNTLEARSKLRTAGYHARQALADVGHHATAGERPVSDAGAINLTDRARLYLRCIEDWKAPFEIVKLLGDSPPAKVTDVKRMLGRLAARGLVYHSRANDTYRTTLEGRQALVGNSLPSGASSQPADSAGDRTGGSK